MTTTPGAKVPHLQSSSPRQAGGQFGPAP
ncbi:hypothetical protein AVEN_198233-1, partial [Araneus ventricosus]